MRIDVLKEKIAKRKASAKAKIADVKNARASTGATYSTLLPKSFQSRLLS